VQPTATSHSQYEHNWGVLMFRRAKLSKVFVGFFTPPFPIALALGWKAICNICFFEFSRLIPHMLTERRIYARSMWMDYPAPAPLFVSHSNCFMKKTQVRSSVYRWVSSPMLIHTSLRTFCWSRIIYYSALTFHYCSCHLLFSWDLTLLYNSLKFLTNAWT
jgi:hypothetical protein